jgi:hypothetical protein
MIFLDKISKAQEANAKKGALHKAKNPSYCKEKSTDCRDNLQNRRKYLQTIHLIRNRNLKDISYSKRTNARNLNRYCS